MNRFLAMSLPLWMLAAQADALCAAPPEIPAAAEPTPVLAGADETDRKTSDRWPVGWDHGLWIGAPTDVLRLRFGGLMQADFGAGDGNNLEKEIGDNFGSRSEFRRVRFNLSGHVTENLEFKGEGSFFVSNPARVTDLYVRLKNLPGIGNLTLGHIKEPIGLERLASSKDTVFLERALPNCFVTYRGFGMMADNAVADERMTWAAGVFHNIDNEVWGSPSQGNSWDATGRVTGLVRYEDAGRDLVHLGGSYSLRWPDHAVTFSQRPEAYFMPTFTRTGDIDAVRVHRLGFETAWVDGPLSVQGEYMAAACEAPTQSNPWLDGFYVQAACFLTGDTHPYDRTKGVFDAVTPQRPLGEDRGCGAWELACRYSFLDLDRSQLSAEARTLNDFTVGLNWYLNREVRLGWNYIHSWLDGKGVDGGADIILMRIQVAF